MNKLFSFHQSLTLATSLTLLRIVLTPCIMYAIMIHSYSTAALLVTIAAATDVLDGLVARLLRQETALGAYLDPIADKILLIGSYIALSLAAHLPVWFVALSIGKEILLVSGAVCLMHRVVPRPTWLAKSTTALQLITIIGALVASIDFSSGYALSGLYIIAALQVITLAQYAVKAYKGLI